MRRRIYLGPTAAGALALNAAPDGKWVFVGSNNNGPRVPEQNPHYHAPPDADEGRLDLLEGRGDRYGVRFAAELHSDVGPQPPSACKPPAPRAQ